jgi:mercuric reductase
MTTPIAPTGLAPAEPTAPTVSTVPTDVTEGAEDGPHVAVAGYDLVVVGGGSAGFAAAITAAAELGNEVAVVNTGPLGGTCTNRGCIPSKTLIRAADAWHRAGRPLFAGLNTAKVELDWKQLQSQKDDLIDALRQTRYVDVLAAYPTITVFDDPGGQARFDTGGRLRLGGQSSGRVIGAKRYVIATGARPRFPRIPGLAEAEPLDSTSLMELTELPESLIVLGGRAVALELGQMMARFGVKVTIVQRSGRLVPDHEPDIGAAIATYLAEDGIQVVTGAHVQRLTRHNDGTRTVHATVLGQAREYPADQVLVALGRQPNTDGLGLDTVGVDLDPGGAIVVDAHQRTTNPAIYAAGDVTPAPDYVYVAAAAGKIAGRNAVTEQPTPLDLNVVPGVIFTDPQIATVGLTEAQAQAAGYDVRSATITMDHLARAQIAHDPCGLIKLVADSSTGRLLGAHVVTPEAGEVIQAATLAVKHGLTVNDLVETLFPYLTYSEGLRLAAVSFDQDLTKLSCCL